MSVVKVNIVYTETNKLCLKLKAWLLPDFCFLEMDVGPCTSYKTSWAYDYKTGRCTTFQYGGCGGNRNNFPDEKYCQYYCKATQGEMNRLKVTIIMADNRSSDVIYTWLC